MPTHPCDKGLTPACFAAYHKWARQALAYKLTRLLLPKELTRRLPGVLRNALIGPGAILPPGLVLPPGAIVPPGFTWPDHWTPWQYFDFTTLEDPRTLFPPGWTPGDPLPPGVVLPPGYALPPGWTPADPPPPAFIPGYSPFPVPPISGAAPPIFIPPFEPGPVHVPPGGAALTQYTASFACNGDESVQSSLGIWATTRDTLNGASVTIGGELPYRNVRAAYTTTTYRISRAVYRFPLTALPPGAQMVSGYLSLKLHSGTAVSVCAQRAPTAVWGNKSDYLSFEGTGHARIITAEGENQLPINSGDLAYILLNAAGTCYLMAREYDHDYLDSPPAVGSDLWTRFMRQGGADPLLYPALVITYKA